jgi:enoyl reductase-like protein
MRRKLNAKWLFLAGKATFEQRFWRKSIRKPLDYVENGTVLGRNSLFLRQFLRTFQRVNNTIATTCKG